MTNEELQAARAEMQRLTRLLLSTNNKFAKRETELTELHRQGRQNYSGDLVTVMNNDLTLRSLSGMSKTVATLAGSLAQVIQAELAWYEHQVRFGRAVRMSPGLRGMVHGEEHRTEGYLRP